MAWNELSSRRDGFVSRRERRGLIEKMELVEVVGKCGMGHAWLVVGWELRLLLIEVVDRELVE